MGIYLSVAGVTLLAPMSCDPDLDSEYLLIVVMYSLETGSKQGSTSVGVTVLDPVYIGIW